MFKIDISTISSLISTLGFPIVACVYMAKEHSRTTKAIEKLVEDQNKQNVETMKTITELKGSIDLMTQALQMRGDMLDSDN